jgi:hypothetical protein
MPPVYAFYDVGRLPAPGDNVAIATRTLPAGTHIADNGRQFALDYTILEGHRFVLHPIVTGEPLLSWGLPFGYASRDLSPGTYVCNAKILLELQSRNLDFPLPATANFYEQIEPYVLDEQRFQPGVQVPRATEPCSFLGYPRSARRGVGTRNYVVILGTTSRTGSYARALEARLRPLVAAYGNLDGIVAVAHTEGGGTHQPHNLEFVLRTLSGFMIHPNVGAVLAVDYGTEPITNAMVRQYMLDHDYPLAAVRHQFSPCAVTFRQTSITAPHTSTRGCRKSTPQHAARRTCHTSKSRCNAAAQTPFQASLEIRWPPGLPRRSSATAVRRI